MMTSKDIKEPPLPLDESRFKGCLTFVDGTLTYYINRRNKANLLWLCWFNYAESPYYEDPSITNHYYPSLTNEENWVEYCETTIIKESDIPQREQDYPLGYRKLDYRLDFYVTKQEFKEAFYGIRQLGQTKGDKRITGVCIFNSLRVVLLQDDEFGIVGEMMDRAVQQDELRQQRQDTLSKIAELRHALPAVTREGKDSLTLLLEDRNRKIGDQA